VPRMPTKCGTSTHPSEVSELKMKADYTSVYM
jgi:hypothetical protein